MVWLAPINPKAFFFLLNSDNKNTRKHNLAWDLYVVATGESCGNGIWETILGMLSVSPFLLKNPFNFSEFIYLYISSESNVRMYLSMQACYHSHSPKRIGQELQDYKKHQVQAGTMTGFLECCISMLLFKTNELGDKCIYRSNRTIPKLEVEEAFSFNKTKQNKIDLWWHVWLATTSEAII